MKSTAKKVKKLLIISAHADDHITCAGTVFKLLDNGYEDLYETVLTTSGEGRDHRQPNGNYDVESLRSKELHQASQFLGTREIFELRQEDLGLNYSKKLVFEVVTIIRRIKPVIGFLMPLFDWHSDHRAAFKIGSEAFKIAATGIKPELGDAHRTPIVLKVEGMLPTKPQILVDVTAYFEKKIELFKIYESQAQSQALRFTEGLACVRGYHLRRPGNFLAEGFTTDATSPIILFDF